jgi:hypothetical protein
LIEFNPKVVTGTMSFRWEKTVQFDVTNLRC